jgi:hypothetical protein
MCVHCCVQLWERILQTMNEVERRTGKQSGCVLCERGCLHAEVGALPSLVYHAVLLSWNQMQTPIPRLYDMAHLELSTSLLHVLMGPCTQVARAAGNYCNLCVVYEFTELLTHHTDPELLAHMLIINSPPFLNILYKIIAPLAPARTLVSSYDFQKPR